MRVLIFMTQFYHLNGAERLGVELAEGLNRNGIHADILSMYTEDLPGVAEAKRELLRKGIPQVHFLGLRPHPPFRSLPSAIRRLRRLLRQGEYDVIETSQVSPTVIAAWATLWGQVGHVAGLHHVYRRGFDDSKLKRFWRWSVRCNSRVLFYAISERAAAHWVEYSGTSPRRTRRVYNGIPDDCFLAVPEWEAVRRELGIPDSGRLAIYVGRLAAFKGIGTLLEALGPVLEEENLFLLYVGQPELSEKDVGETLQDLEQRVDAEGWSDRVRFLGFRSDVPRLMASADVLVHPSRTEAFGLVLVEAMAAGLPVVASNVEAIPEVLAGTDSIMVEPNDAGALRAAVLATLRRTPEESATAAEKGRRRAEAFRSERRVEAMIGLFKEAQRGRPPLPANGTAGNRT